MNQFFTFPFYWICFINRLTIDFDRYGLVPRSTGRPNFNDGYSNIENGFVFKEIIWTNAWTKIYYCYSNMYNYRGGVQYRNPKFLSRYFSMSRLFMEREKHLLVAPSFSKNLCTSLYFIGPSLIGEKPSISVKWLGLPYLPPSGFPFLPMLCSPGASLPRVGHGHT